MSSMRVIVSAICLVVVGGLWWSLNVLRSEPTVDRAAGAEPAHPTDEAPPSDPKQTPLQEDIRAAPAEPDVWEGAAFAKTLDGTQIDGHLIADGQDALVVDMGVRDFFDYFLSTVGQRSLDEVVAELDRQISRRLPPPAAAQAKQLLRDYIAYQRAQAALLAQPSLPASQQSPEYYARVVADTFERLKTIRREHFSPATADAFFGVEEAFGEYTVGALAVRADPTLTETERQSRLQALEQELPQAMVAAARRAELRSESAAKARQAWASGATPTEVRSVLSRAYAPAEIDGMLAFWASEADWQARLTAYREARDDVVTSTPLGPARNRAVAQLRRRFFTQPELARLDAEDAMQLRD